MSNPVNGSGNRAYSCAETVPASGFIYFVTDGTGAVKIGFTENVRRRLAGLQTGHHAPLVLMGAIPATLDAEQFIHQKFKHLKIRGEWFRSTQELIDFIADPVLPEPPPPPPIVVKVLAPVPVAPFPQSHDKFKPWADAACVAWPGDLQVAGYLAWRALEKHPAYPAHHVNDFSDRFSQWVASRRASKGGA